VAISFIASTSAGGASGSEPSGTTSGDMIIASAISSSSSLAAPAGWAQLGSTLTANGYSCGTWYIVRGGSAPSYTWTNMAGANDGVNVSTYRGVYGAPFDAIATATAGSAVAPTVWANAATDWLVCTYNDASAASITAPSGMTLDGGFGDFTAIAHLSLSVTGFTGTKTFGATSAPVGAVSILLIGAPPPIPGAYFKPRSLRQPTVLRKAHRVAPMPTPPQELPYTTNTPPTLRRASNLARRGKVQTTTPVVPPPPFVAQMATARRRAPGLVRWGKVQPQRIPAQANPLFIIPAVTSRAKRIFRPHPGFFAPIPPQVNPIIQIRPVFTRARMVFRPRVKQTAIIPPQFNPIDVIQPTLRPWRRVNLVKRQQGFNPWLKQVVPPIAPGPVGRSFRRVNLVRRATTPTVVPQQPIPIQATTRAPRRFNLVRRGRAAAPIQAQQNPVFLIPVVLRPWRRVNLVRRGQGVLPVQKQVNPPDVQIWAQPRRRLALLRRRPNTWAPPVDQILVPPPERSRFRVVFRPRTARGVSVVGPQLNPVMNIQPVTPRRRLGLPRRGTVKTPVPLQVNPSITIQPTTPRRRFNLPRRGKVVLTWPQAPPPFLQGATIQRRRLVATLRRRNIVTVIPQQTPPLAKQRLALRPAPGIRWLGRSANPAPPQSSSVGTTRKVLFRRYAQLARRGSNKIPAFGGLAPVLDILILSITEIQPGWNVTDQPIAWQFTEQTGSHPM
jgi:hypothetical protein